MRLKVLVLFIVPFFLFASITVMRGRVVRVSDGDTIVVLVDGAEQRIRLYGIDCPEKKQAFGTRAKEFAAAFCFGKEVVVEVRSVDRYGRSIGEVRVPGEELSLNRALVSAGLAWWYEQYAKNDRDLKERQEEARAAKRGLWGDEAPVAPWEFRRRK